MTYSISITGHGAASDDVIEAFENFVRALRTVNAEGIKDVQPGISDQSYISGSAGGMGIAGDNFTKSASDVQDLEAEDTSSDQDDAEPAAGEAPDEETDPEAEVEP
jgi:hypothetical protein